MNPRDLPDDDEPGFFRRNLVMIIIGLLAIGGGGYFCASFKPAKQSATRERDTIIIVKVDDTPRPPLPEPVQEKNPPKEDKQIDELPAEVEPPAKTSQDVVDTPEQTPLGTAISGGDGSGLQFGDHSGVAGGRKGMIGQTYTERGRWQGDFSRAVSELLAGNPHLKHAKGNVTFRLWLDEAGRVQRVVLNGSTGDKRQDEVLRTSALTGRTFEPAPTGTPMPVIMRFASR